MNAMRTIRRMTLAIMALMLSTLTFAGPVFAQDSADVALDSPIRSLLLDPSETRIDLDIDLFNYADERRIINLELVDVPEGWDIGVWNAFFDFRISELVVEPTETTPGQRPRMRIRFPDTRPAPGDYPFTLIITDAANSRIEYDRATFTIGVPEGVEVDAGSVELSADFPQLSGPANSSQEFEVIIKNTTTEDHSFNMVAGVVDDPDGATPQLLPGWDINFTPAFGEPKVISTIAIRAAIDERVNVHVEAPLFVPAGEYSVLMIVESEDELLHDEIILTFEVTGKGEILASTQSGRLSMDATAGEATRNVLRFNNIGTADLSDLKVSADAPPEWGVEFVFGDTIENLPAGQQIDWDVEVTPPDDAIPGDYEIIFRGTTSNALDSAVIRVSVSQSSIWGWLGIVLVILVIGALMGLFWRLGRR
jgi:uncharacterized membrane protein